MARESPNIVASLSFLDRLIEEPEPDAEALADAFESLLRREGIPGAREKLKAFRGRSQVNRQDVEDFVYGLEAPESVKAEILKLLPAVRMSGSLEHLKKALKRDLEALLNTRRNPDPLPDGCPEVQRSMYYYGLPDITSIALQSDPDRKRLQRTLEETISAMEPRLHEVRVSFETPAPGEIRTLHFRIDALLRVEPAPERISFDTILQLSSGEYRVRGERRAG
ncbi:MAG TPA: type VI secretion system baseplate subunit TssE [Bryobacteraceae bacterium]|jgi:type VI secretion system protein ImpF|nr:type VI secretion system baseplate subunit TssE [Bryobacteraceae bacterium]